MADDHFFFNPRRNDYSLEERKGEDKTANNNIFHAINSEKCIEIFKGSIIFGITSEYKSSKQNLTPDLNLTFFVKFYHIFGKGLYVVWTLFMESHQAFDGLLRF